MSRKTYSLSAAAIAAVASLTFSSADLSGAVAQESDAEAASAIETENQDSAIELMPTDVQFVSEPVVQSIPAADEIDLAEPQTAGSLRELVGMVDTDTALSEQMHCLAGAVYFESRGEPLNGQLAVAQVVINRTEDRRFPASYCDVVFQRAQFSFVKNGRMPRIKTSSNAWTRAKAIARIAHEGLWESEARDSLYFHANYVRPKWSRQKTTRATIDTHIFYR